MAPTPPGPPRVAPTGTIEIRGNCLFMGSDAGGQWAAVIYSLVEMAKLNELDPVGYLREVLGRIADHPIHRIDELLPRNIWRHDDEQ